MNILTQPGLVLISGMPSAGKTTAGNGIAKNIANAFVLHRDRILYEILQVSQVETPRLLSFEEYVAEDGVFLPGNYSLRKTHFGDFIQIQHDHPDGTCDFHRRHARDQSFLVMLGTALDNLTLGKLVVVEGFLGYHYRSGAMRNIFEAPEFHGFPKYLIHLEVSREECAKRIRDRALRGDYLAEPWVRGERLEGEKFTRWLEDKHIPYPELGELPHLMLDTTFMLVEEVTQKCVNWILQSRC